MSPEDSNDLFVWSNSARPSSMRSSSASLNLEDNPNGIPFAYRGSTVSIGRPSTVVNPIMHASGRSPAPQLSDATDAADFHSTVLNSRVDTTSNGGEDDIYSYRLSSISSIDEEGKVIEMQLSGNVRK